MAATYISGASGTKTTTTGTTIVITYTSTLGNQLLCSIVVAGNTTVSSVTDTAGNVWHALGALNNGTGVRVELWKTDLVNALAVTSVTVTLSSSGTRAAATVEEYSKVAFVSSFVTNTATGSTSPLTTGAQFVQRADDFLFAAGGTAANNVFTQVSGTIRHQNGTTGCRVMSEDVTGATVGTDSASMTAASWAVVFATVRGVTDTDDTLTMSDLPFGFGLGFSKTEQMVMSDSAIVAVPLTNVVSDNLNAWADSLSGVGYGVLFSDQLPSWSDAYTQIVTPITFLNAWTGNATGSAASLLVTITGGMSNKTSVILVVVGCVQTTTSVSSITDAAGNSYSLVGAQNGSTRRVELWASQIDPIPVTAGNKVTVNYSNSADAIVVVVGTYEGVISLGAVVTNTGATSLLTVTESTTQSDNFIAAGLLGSGPQVMTGTSGALEAQVTNASTARACLMDNNGASAGPLTCSATVSANTNSAEVAVELQAPLNPVLTELLSDTMIMSDLPFGFGFGFPNTEQMVMSDAFVDVMEMDVIASDTLSMTDAAIEVLGFSEQFADLLLLTDALTVGYGSAVSDQMVLIDAIGSGYGAGIADQLVLADSIGAGYGDVFSDQLVLTDAFSLAVVIMEAFSDQMTLTDSDVEVLGLNETASDQLSLADAVAAGYGAAASDQLNFIDIVGAGYGAVVSDQLVFSDAEVLVFGLAVNVTETLSMSDQTGTGYGLAVIESLVMTESVVIAEALDLGITETLVLTDSLAVGYGASLNGVLTMSDAEVLTFGLGINIIETLTLGDQIGAGYGFAITDSLNNWNETVAIFTNQPSLQESLTDQLTMADSLGIGYGLSIIDQLLLTDAVLQVVGIQEQLTDQFVLSDTIGTGTGLSITETLPLADNVLIGYGLQLTDTESANWADAFFAAGSLLTESLSDAMTLADALGVGYGQGIVEQLTFIDVLGMGYGQLVTDQLIESDSLGVGYGIAEVDVLEQQDAIGTGTGSGTADSMNNWSDGFTFELAGPQLPILISVADSMTMSDSFTFMNAGGIGPITVRTIGIQVQVIADSIRVEEQAEAQNIRVTEEVQVDDIQIQ